jgi:hypothetical protein
LKPLGREKGTFRALFVPFFGDPEFPVQQRVLLHPHWKKRPATSPPPALHASRALLPACKPSTLSGTMNGGRCSTFGALTNEMDWVTVKQLISAGVIKKNGHQVSDFGTTALC